MECACSLNKGSELQMLNISQKSHISNGIGVHKIYFCRNYVVYSSHYTVEISQINNSAYRFL